MHHSGQTRARKTVLEGVKKIHNVTIKEITLRAQQKSIARRMQYKQEKSSAEGDVKRQRTTKEMGHLDKFPCLKEQCIIGYSCAIPEVRNHLKSMPGIDNSGYPEQIISLPNPELLEPKVTMDLKKTIFKPDADGPSRIRDKENETTMEKPDMDSKLTVPLCHFGRDEDWWKNQLWLMGTSQVILWGVGNGMLPWVCLQLRIPIVCIYESQGHKQVIEKHLLEKIVKQMDDKTDVRWWKSDEDLGVTPSEEEEKTEAKNKAEEAKKKAEEAKKKKEEAKKKKEEAQKKKGQGKNIESSSDLSDSSSSSTKNKENKEIKDKKHKSKK